MLLVSFICSLGRVLTTASWSRIISLCKQCNVKDWVMSTTNFPLTKYTIKISQMIEKTKIRKIHKNTKQSCKKHPGFERTFTKKKWMVSLNRSVIYFNVQKHLAWTLRCQLYQSTWNHIGTLLRIKIKIQTKRWSMPGTCQTHPATAASFSHLFVVG